MPVLALSNAIRPVDDEDEGGEGEKGKGAPAEAAEKRNGVGGTFRN